MTDYCEKIPSKNSALFENNAHSAFLLLNGDFTGFEIEKQDLISTGMNTLCPLLLCSHKKSKKLIFL